MLTTWQVDRVHGFDQSLLLEPMLSPAGQSEPASYGLLETLNRLAARVDRFKASPAFIQSVAGLDSNLHDPAGAAGALSDGTLLDRVQRGLA